MASNNKYTGGYRTYGGFLGVLMLDTTTPRPPGDCGNAKSYDYPVQFQTVEGASANEVVEAPNPEEIVDPFVAAGQELVEQGAAGIVTGCGYLIRFQDEFASQIPDVPIFSSPLLQIPIIKQIIADNEQIGVLVSNEESFADLDHSLVADNYDRLEVKGLDETQYFRDVFLDQTSDTLDMEIMNETILSAAEELVDQSNLGAILFECTNLHPYAELVQQETELPVFDQLTLADLAWRATTHTRY